MPKTKSGLITRLTLPNSRLGGNSEAISGPFAVGSRRKTTDEHGWTRILNIHLAAILPERGSRLSNCHQVLKGLSISVYPRSWISRGRIVSHARRVGLLRVLDKIRAIS